MSQSPPESGKNNIERETAATMSSTITSSHQRGPKSRILTGSYNEVTATIIVDI